MKCPGGAHPRPSCAGRPPCGGRGLKYSGGCRFYRWQGRPPCGGRGLKSNNRPACHCKAHCRPPCGGRGLKCLQRGYTIGRMLSPPVWGAWIEIECRYRDSDSGGASPPVWGAWIEIGSRISFGALRSSPPVWGAWIEIPRRPVHLPGPDASPPVWGAWIEIGDAGWAGLRHEVAPRVGGVD